MWDGHIHMISSLPQPTLPQLPKPTLSQEHSHILLKSHTMDTHTHTHTHHQHYLSGSQHYTPTHLPLYLFITISMLNNCVWNGPIHAWYVSIITTRQPLRTYSQNRSHSIPSPNNCYSTTKSYIYHHFIFTTIHTAHHTAHTPQTPYNHHHHHHHHHHHYIKMYTTPVQGDW